MAVPKRKTSKSKRDMRRSHDGLAASNAVTCKKCGEMKAQHNVCKACGSYDGKEIISTKSKKTAE